MRISDWSSDVCSSDLFNMIRNLGGSIGIALLQTFTEAREQYHFSIIAARLTQNGLLVQERIRDLTQSFLPTANGIDEIGKASCRERVCQYLDIWVVAGLLKKKK